MPATKHPKPKDPLAGALAAARAWRSMRQNPRRAKPNYRAFFDLAENLHFDDIDPWPVMDIVRYLKERDPAGIKAFAKTSQNALHKALCRHLTHARQQRTAAQN